MVPAEVHPPRLCLFSTFFVFFVALRLELFCSCYFLFSSWWPGSMVWTLCAFSCFASSPSNQDIVLMWPFGVYKEFLIFNTRVTTFSLTHPPLFIIYTLHFSENPNKSAVLVSIRPQCEQTSSLVFFFSFFPPRGLSVVIHDWSIFFPVYLTSSVITGKIAQSLSVSVTKALYLQSDVESTRAMLKPSPSLWYFVLLKREHVLTGQH